MSVLYVDEVQIDLGEAIHITCTVKHKCANGPAFSIGGAKWILYDPSGEVEAQGDCKIDGHDIDAFVSPKKAGNYKLKYSYIIMDETWVDNVRLRVG